MQKVKEVQEYTAKKKLCEIYQKSGVRFAFLSAPRDGSAQCHPYVKCRDFLHDAVRAAVTGNAGAIHGFSYDPAVDPPIDLKRIRLLVTHKDLDTDKTLAKFIKKALKLIHHYENMVGIKAKTCAKLQSDGVYMISGPKMWLRSPALTSLYTLLFRLADHKLKFKKHDNEELIEAYSKIADKEGQNDLKYLWYMYDILHVIVENHKRVFDLYRNIYEPTMLANTSISTYHNRRGILAFCQNNYDNSKQYKVLQELIRDDMEQKKLLRVKGLGEIGPYESYEPRRVHWAFANVIDDKRVQCHKFTACREYLIGSYRSILPKTKDISFHITSDGATHETDDQKMRLLIKVPGVLKDREKMTIHKEELFFAKKLLNFYENKYGMKKTVISTVILEHGKSDQYAWLFTGGQEWISSPVMISIFCQLLRSAKTYAYCVNNTDAGFKAIETLTEESIAKMWKSLSKNGKLMGFSDGILHAKHPQIMTALKNRKTLFVSKAFRDNFFLDVDNRSNGSYYNRCGINSLVDDKFVDSETAKKYKECLKKDE